MFSRGSALFQIDDIPDIQIQEKLKIIKSATSEESFQQAIDAFPERFEAGITKFKVPFKDKKLFIQEVCEHFCISTCLEEIQDVVKGMDIYGLGTVFIDHPEVDHEFNVCEQSKAIDLIEIYGNVSYTNVVENDCESKKFKDLEIDVYYNFTNFIESLEEEEYKSEVIEIDEDVVSTKNKCISINDVVRFLTGSKYVLPSMKGQGVVKFYHPNDAEYGQRVTVRTCTYEIIFPITKRYYGSSNDFVVNFCEDILSAPGFGIA